MKLIAASCISHLAASEETSILDGASVDVVGAQIRTDFPVKPENLIDGFFKNLCASEAEMIVSENEKSREFMVDLQQNTALKSAFVTQPAKDTWKINK